MLVVVEGGELENPAKNPWSKEITNSKLHVTLRQDGTWWEGSGLTTVPALLPQLLFSFLKACSLLVRLYLVFYYRCYVTLHIQ